MLILLFNEEKYNEQRVVVNTYKIPVIFICHSSLDKKLLEEIKILIEEQKCIPFIAQQKISESNPYENIMSAIWRSDAVFAILTENALTKQSTRDWIFFELGYAKGVWREQENYYLKHSIFAWKDPKIKLPRANPIEFITSYRPLVKRSRKSRNQMLEEMKEISGNLWNISQSEPAPLKELGKGILVSLSAAPHTFSVEWRLSGSVMAVPPYGSRDIPNSDSASELIVHQLEEEGNVNIICDMSGLRPKTRYRLVIGKSYTPHSSKYPGNFSDTIPPISFVTDSEGCGKRVFNFRYYDSSHYTIHTLSVWLNQLDPNLTILISDNFDVMVSS